MKDKDYADNCQKEWDRINRSRLVQNYEFNHEFRAGGKDARWCFTCGKYKTDIIHASPDLDKDEVLDSFIERYSNKQAE